MGADFCRNAAYILRKWGLRRSKCKQHYRWEVERQCLRAPTKYFPEKIALGLKEIAMHNRKHKTGEFTDSPKLESKLVKN